MKALVHVLCLLGFCEMADIILPRRVLSQEISRPVVIMWMKHLSPASADHLGGRP